MATTRKDLENLVNRLANIAGKATSEKQAIELNQDMYLDLEYHNGYGGYRLVNVKVDSRSHHEAFGMSDTAPRLRAAAMRDKLQGLILGIEHQKQVQNGQ